MLHTVGFVGGLDVHKGHGGGLAILVFFVTEDLHTLDPSKSEITKIKVIFSFFFREMIEFSLDREEMKFFSVTVFIVRATYSIHILGPCADYIK